MVSMAIRIGIVGGGIGGLTLGRAEVFLSKGDSNERDREAAGVGNSRYSDR